MFKKHTGKVVGIIMGWALLFGNSMGGPWYQSEARSNGMVSRLSTDPEMQSQRAFENFNFETVERHGSRETGAIALKSQYVIRVCHPNAAGNYCEFTANFASKRHTKMDTYPVTFHDIYHTFKLKTFPENSIKSLGEFCERYDRTQLRSILSFTLTKDTKLEEPDAILERNFIPVDPDLGLQISEKLRRVSPEEASCPQFLNEEPRR
ncbi:MAG: hypothetical protein HY559_03040 [Gammaproteobacteria bacterium]|nr:hypothetical protein [Gammaproteobacteria bacterium]